MRFILSATALLSLSLVTAPLQAADGFKAGTRSYTVGMYDSAARHWRSMAEKGNGAAQYNIGRMIYYGRGTRKDPIEAYKWFLLASANGINQGRIAARLLGDKLTRKQIVEATVRARDLQRRYSR